MRDPEIMVDIETLGTDHNAVILSIGSVVFDADTGATIADFYLNVDAESQPNRCIDPATVMWWLRKSEEARSALNGNQFDIGHALQSWLTWFSQWRLPGRPELLLWSKSPSFDVAILRHAAKQEKVPFPFKYSQERDVRTAEAALERFLTDYRAPKPEHHALDDAKGQVETVINFYEAMRR
jgi:hypothetical protein